MHIERSDIILRANPSRVLLRPLASGTNPFSRSRKHFIDRVLLLSETEVSNLMLEAESLFKHRHKDLSSVLMDNYNLLSKRIPERNSLSEKRKLLLGATFTKEYSIQAAALFNPSIVSHPDQSGLKKNNKRFIMSLRSVGEGHISSIEFRTGILDSEGHISMDKESQYASNTARDKEKTFNKNEISIEVKNNPHFDLSILKELQNTFTQADYLAYKKTDAYQNIDIETRETLDIIVELNYDVFLDQKDSISECVIYPNAPHELMGMEDVRFVQFSDDEKKTYVGTYTAYNGRKIRPQLILTEDFIHFKIRALYGDAASDKGMALFPEKINGKYAMIGRQGGENITIMYSDDLFHWDDYQILLKPKFGWEILQIGNCGSPLKTNRGWLLMTHGVGPLRRYSISAVLLDINDPSKVIGRCEKPLLSPLETEREGYVPNVVYSCGSMIHGEKLIIPYALSDSATTFATIELKDLLNNMNPV